MSDLTDEITADLTGLPEEIIAHIMVYWTGDPLPFLEQIRIVPLIRNVPKVADTFGLHAEGAESCLLPAEDCQKEFIATAFVSNKLFMNDMLTFARTLGVTPKTVELAKIRKRYNCMLEIYISLSTNIIFQNRINLLYITHLNLIKN